MNQNYAVDKRLKLFKNSDLICNRSISLNHLNKSYFDNNYKEKYLNLKEQHEETKKNLNNQQDQLKQLNYRLQRILQEKKNFLSQFISLSQVKTENLIQELEINNCFLHKENEKLKNQLLLEKFKSPQNSKNNYGKIMIINMKQDIKTNYDWVKARIDSGLYNQTKRNPKNGQLFRQTNKKYSFSQKNQEKKFKLTQQRPSINKERQRVSFCNQLKTENSYNMNTELKEKYSFLDKNNDNFNYLKEIDAFEKTENSFDNFSESTDDNNFKSYPIKTKSFDLNNSLFQLKKNENSDHDEYLSNEEDNLKKAEKEIKRLKEIIFSQNNFIDKQKKNNFQTSNQQENMFEVSNSSFSSFTMNEKSDNQILNIKDEKIINLAKLDYFLNPNDKKDFFSNSDLNLNQIEDLNTISKDSMEKNNLDSLNSSLKNYSFSESKNKKKLSIDLNENSHSFNELALNINKQNNALLIEKLEIEKMNNQQIKIKYKARVKELEQNLNELKTENQILRNSLEKCIQDCLKEIGGC